ncbi:MAG: ABC transporter [Flavobacteriales bacterium]|nr:ABC transporter [Flavobacteriales bacterium]|tara:strand:- start:1667 stop:3526 length:1860 start_codon:yes stop_codon:yes gene_type:complete
MNYLSVQDLSKSYGIQTLFEGINFGVDQGQKIALVARNGTGKTTILRALAGVEPADNGEVVFRKDLQIGFLQQEADFGSFTTVYDALYGSENLMLSAIKEYELALLKPENSEALQTAFEKMDRLNAWDYEVKVKTILSKLKLEELKQEISVLSGGQRKRLSLAKLLIDQPDFLILDEPTNHLDLEMIEWLEEYLIKEQVTLLMVTHDRYFLDAICNEILELEEGELYKFKGNYTYYLEKKKERQTVMQTNIYKAKNLYSKELEWMRRQPKARGVKSKARIVSFYDVEKSAKKRIKNEKVQLEVQMTRMGSKIVEFHKVNKAFGSLLILDKFNYTFKKSDRIGIVGKNGVGKSTLLNMLTGQESIDSGKIVIGDTVVMGYYTQRGMKMDPSKRVIEIVRDIAEFIPLSGGRKLTASQMLERFLFSKDAQWKNVSVLSGGEKKRLYLLTILMQNPNFLILDEPTNDLDLITLKVLEDFLDDFAGCIITVSHDRYFMDRLVDHLFVFEGEGQVRDFPGNYTDYRAHDLQTKSKVERPKEKVSTKSKQIKERRSLSYSERNEYENLETLIEGLEKEKVFLISQFDQEDLSSEKIKELSFQIKILDQNIYLKTNRWMELDDLSQ